MTDVSSLKERFGVQSSERFVGLYEIDLEPTFGASV